MDENKNGTPVPEKDTTPNTTENTNQLEYDGGITITPPEENEDFFDPTKKDALCILCEKRFPDKRFGEDYDLCTECRNSLIRSPLRVKGFVAVIVLIFIASFGIILSGMQKTTIEGITAGLSLAEEGKNESALNTIAPLQNIGWKTAGKVAKICHELGSISDVDYLLSNYYYDETDGEKVSLSDKIGKSDLNAPWNKSVKELQLVIEYDTTHSALFYEHYEKYYYGQITAEQIPYDTIIAEYENSLTSASNDLEKAVIYYYMVATAEICGKDTNIKYDYCRKVAELAPDTQWLYIDNMVTFAIELGNYEEAEMYIEEMRKNNSESIYPDRYLAVMYRRQGKYDQAIQIFESLTETVDQHEIYSIFYDAALCYFIKGDLESAYEAIAVCYEEEAHLTVDSVNLYAIICKELNDNEGYNNAVEFFESYEMKLSPTVDKYLAGEITKEELFKNGEVVFE